MKTITSSVSALIFILGVSLVFLNDLNYIDRYGRRTGSIDSELQDFGRYPVIVILIAQNTNLIDLCQSMKTLTNAQGSIKTPILAFHLESKPTLVNQNMLSACTDRAVFFAVVDLDQFPDGFEPIAGEDYTSAQINRFWTTTIWDHKALSSFDVIMKIDENTCFSTPNSLPNFSSSSHVYKSIVGNVDPNPFKFSVDTNPFEAEGMHDFATKYMNDHGIEKPNLTTWLKEMAGFTDSSTDTLPTFKDSFELVRKDFMQRQDVHNWHKALTDESPYGYFNAGWNLKSARFLTMSIFGSEDTVDITTVGLCQDNISINDAMP